MNKQQKLNLEINQLTSIIHHGVHQHSTDASLDIFFDKLTNQLPLGADAPTFNSRKRFISLQLLIKTIQFLILFLICAIIAICFLFVSFGETTNFVFLAIGFICLILSIFFLAKCIGRIQIFSAIKNVVQTIPDPEKKFPVIDEQAIAQQFSKERVKARIAGCFIALVGGSITAYILTTPLQSVVAIAFIAPLFLMLGIGLIIHPISKAESLYRHGTAQLPWKDFPAILKLCTIIGVCFSILLLGLSQGFFNLS